MIVNIVDGRKHKFRFQKVNAVIEAAWHDNSCKDSDQVENLGGPDYAEREHITLQTAIAWGNSYKEDVTLYLYDKDGGIYPTHESTRDGRTHLLKRKRK